MKKLVVGTTNHFYPYSYNDQKAGFIGYEIDLSQSLAEYLHVEIEYKGYESVSDTISAILENEVDLSIASISNTQSRRKILDFSGPYFDPYYHSIAVSQCKNLTDWKDLDKPGIVIGVSHDSLADKIAQVMFQKATVKQFNNGTLAGQAILNQQVDAIIAGDAWIKAYQMQNHDKISILVARFGQPNYSGIAVAKYNDGLLSKIEQFLNKYRTSDAIVQNQQKWFNELDNYGLMLPMA